MKWRRQSRSRARLAWDGPFPAVLPPGSRKHGVTLPARTVTRPSAPLTLARELQRRIRGGMRTLVGRAACRHASRSATRVPCMECKKIGHTDVRVPEIGIGTWEYKGGTDLLRKAVELGAALIDTGLVSNQLRYSLIVRTIEPRTYPYCHHRSRVQSVGGFVPEAPGQEYPAAPAWSLRQEVARRPRKN